MTESVPRPDRPVLVVGPPRSGTTMLRHALNRHPSLAILPETHLCDVWLPRFPALPERREADAFLDAFTSGEDFARSGLDAAEVRARLAGCPRVDGATVMAVLLDRWATAHGTPRVGEKTPAHALHLDLLLDWFPDARVIWMRRDPRATTASQMAFEQDWAADEPATPARQWARIERAWRRWRHDPRVLTVVYEDLVARPDEGLRLVLDHAGLEPDPAVVAGPPPRPGRWHGGHDPAARPTADRVDRWTERLTPSDVGIVDALTVYARRGTPWPPAGSYYAGSDRWRYRWGHVRAWAAVADEHGRALLRRAAGRGRA